MRIFIALVVALLVISCGASPASVDDAATTDGGTADAGDAGRPDTGACAAPDGDGDGAPSLACGGTDCDDADPDRFPGHSEICDAAAHDEDCDDSTVGVRDADADGSTDAACCNGSHCGDDCNDAQNGVHPGAPEVCNAIDDDCDAATDEGLAVDLWPDRDGDMFGDRSAISTRGCPGSGLATNGTDCDDTLAGVNPTSAELCDGLDNDCSGTIDDGVMMADLFPDCDVDGYGRTGSTAMHGCPDVIRASPPVGCPAGSWVADATDCDDGDATIAPMAAEACNGTDDDCDASTDEGAAVACALPEAVAACTGGSCTVASCTSPYLDCTTGAGCETDPRTTAAHCGNCATSCAWACAASTCDAAISVVAGGAFACALRASGTVNCWGYNAEGDLGDGTRTPRSTPVASGAVAATQIDLGDDHVCFLSGSGGVSCWGLGASGQLGDGTGTSSTSPVAALGIAGAVEVATGLSHSCARRSDGTVVCWGSNGSGEIGDGTLTTRPAPRMVVGLIDAVELAAGSEHTCARRATGAVVCWGNNTSGQIGDGTTSLTRAMPTAVMGLTDAVEITAGQLHTCARRAAGPVVCWGANTQGQLGDGTGVDHSAPVVVSGLVDAVQIDSFMQHVCARRSTGGVVCWGSNASGQLGDGTIAPSDVPVDVVGLVDAVDVTAGTNATCARRATGDIVCWGGNTYGQLGDGTMTPSRIPVDVVSP